MRPNYRAFIVKLVPSIAFGHEKYTVDTDIDWNVQCGGQEPCFTTFAISSIDRVCCNIFPF